MPEQIEQKRKVNGIAVYAKKELAINQFPA